MNKHHKSKNTFVQSPSRPRDGNHISLVETFLQENVIPSQVYGNLHANREKRKGNHEMYNDSAPSDSNTLVVHTTPKSLDFQISLRFRYYKGKGLDYALSWVDQFRHEVLKAEFEDTKVLKLIQVLLPSRVYTNIKTKLTVDTQLDALVSLEAPQSQLQHLLHEISSIKQTNFVYIEEYLTKIQDLSRKIAILQKDTKEQQEYRVQSSFTAGIGSYTSIFLAKSDTFGMKESFAKILKLEESLISQIGQQNNTHLDYTPRKFQTEHGFSAIKKGNNLKWCSYHKTSNHDNLECRRQKYHKAPMKSNGGKEEANAILLNKVHPRPIVMCKINEHINLEALLDSGSSKSLINSEICKSIPNLTLEKNDTQAQVFSANNQRMSIRGEAKIGISMAANPYVSFSINCLVTENLSHSLILGRDFLETQEVILNFRENTISIAQIEIEMPTENSLDELEKSFKKKINYDTCNSLFNKKISHPDPNFPNKISNIYHEINTEPSKFVALKQYPVPTKYIKSARKELQRLLKSKIIRKSKEGWSSPAFCLIKKNGDIRIAVDYRCLNSITKPLFHPNPSISELLQGLHGATHFSTIDLEKGYHQVPIEPDHVYKTGFVMLNEHYEFINMPLGLANAPKTFQRIMQSLLGHLDFIKIYLDDVLIFSESYECHQIHVKETLEIIRNFGLKINLAKCNFNKTEVCFLGRTISHQKITLNTDMLDKKVFSRSPQTKRQLQALLGSINWARPFIPNLSDKILKLTNKLRDKKITWDKEDAAILEGIKQDILKNDGLFHANLNKDFDLYTDASKTGIGGILKQNDKAVAIFSKKLTQSEQNYSVSEKETFAIVKSMFYFRDFIIGSHVNIFTDNQNACFKKTFYYLEHHVG